MTNSALDTLPMLTPRQAYLAMLVFLENEFNLIQPETTINLGGLISEMSPESDGSTSDHGAELTFSEAISKVLSPGYHSKWDCIESDV